MLKVADRELIETVNRINQEANGRFKIQLNLNSSAIAYSVEMTHGPLPGVLATGSKLEIYRYLCGLELATAIYTRA